MRNSENPMELSHEALLFSQLINHHDVFFFAGSGISYASKLPSAEKILRVTARAALKDAAEGFVKLASSLQPELFYEALIRICGDRRCLEAWRSLHKGTQEKFGCIAEPNSAHFAIVEYSRCAGAPILTTNFDTMFERAADILGVRYRVLGPKDLPPDANDILSICKIHGSIEDRDGSFDVNSLWTTATEISTFNPSWINYIMNLMKKMHICYVGYSGRDIDIFPHIRSFSLSATKEYKSILWVNRFSPTDPSTLNAESCRAIKIDGYYPSELFSQIGMRGSVSAPMSIVSESV